MLNADQLIGAEYSKLSVGVRSRYRAAHDSDAIQCDSEPLVSCRLSFLLGKLQTLDSPQVPATVLYMTAVPHTATPSPLRGIGW